MVAEEELCPDCFKVVGTKSRYKLVCTLGKAPQGLTVTKLTEALKLRQPTVTHHLSVLRSVGAVDSVDIGRERVYSLKGTRTALRSVKYLISNYTLCLIFLATSPST